MNILLEKNYLNFPVKNGVDKKRIKLEIEGKTVREFEIELAVADPDFWVFLDVSKFHGRDAELASDTELSAESLNLIHQSDEFKGSEGLYEEALRPQFHFSSRRGWNNDPNGLVYYDGEYHLYYQHNPYGWRWGNMHWGHAVSTDLVHWQELPIAIYPHEFGDWAFSGSAVVDSANTAGFKIGEEDVIVAAYTSTGRVSKDSPICGECIAYSNDRGRTFTEYEGNPVVAHQGRDPKLIWFEPGQHWVMAVYEEEGNDDNRKRFIAFFSSPDLKSWEFQSRIEGYYECAELFELPVDGDTGSTRWILFAADAKYAVGSFDGRKFVPEHEGKHQVHFGSYYASQTFSNAPDGRRIQIGWGRIEMKDMPFNQMMGFPTELALRSTEDGIRMFVEPVKEVSVLFGQQRTLATTVRPESPAKLLVETGLLHIKATIQLLDASSFMLEFGEHQVTYDAKEQTLQEMPLKPEGGCIHLELLLDRSSVEICGNHGRVYHTAPMTAQGEIREIAVWSNGGDTEILSLSVYELRSIW
ncbi:MAG: glycoside hydrolase family 32 protein [Planctomycetota bacterium]|nr:glycoside hydrolase family 32 protein [Planctomycetota bacterium]